MVCTGTGHISVFTLTFALIPAIPCLVPGRGDAVLITHAISQLDIHGRLKSRWISCKDTTCLEFRGEHLEKSPSVTRIVAPISVIFV